MRDRIGVILFFITLMLVMSIVCSCTTTRTIELIKRDSVYIDRLKRDSIYQRDSIYMLIKGDTVFKYQYKYRYRDKLLRDTIAISKTDSIPYPVEVPKYVEKKLSWWQSTLLYTGAIAWIVAIIGLAYWTNKRFNWFSFLLKLIKL
jgi:hypothetical protein